MPTEDDLPLLYLEAEDVLGLYAEIFDLTMEEAGDRLRNEVGLRSALNRPRTYAHYQGADVALQAAVLAHGIAEGQHFLEGNKRTALVAMRTFLAINGYDVDASQRERADWILSLSKGVTAEQLAERLRPALVEQGPAAEED
jgi:death on curing protein